VRISKVFLVITTIISSQFLLTFNNASAWTGGGGQGCGSCLTIPKDLEESAKQLEKQFLQFDRKSLLIEQFAGSLCLNHHCGEIDEEQASLLLERFFQERDRGEAWWLNLLSIAIAAAGVLIGGLAYRHGVEAERQSVRNEVEIDHLKEKPAKRIAG
jgi:hypothetical protein